MPELRKKLFEKSKTYKPKKHYEKGTKRYNLHEFARSLLRSGDLVHAVKLPDGADVNHWLSIHTLDFFHISNVIFGSVTEFCTEVSCPVMSSGPRFEYLWRDGKTYKKATHVSAPKYVDLLMNWIGEQVCDPCIFPTDDEDQTYPENFYHIVKNIFRRLFRIFSHIYYHHFVIMRELGEESHLNTAFKHFMYFVWEFNLIDAHEIFPLYDLIRNLMWEKAEEKFAMKIINQ